MKFKNLLCGALAGALLVAQPAFAATASNVVPKGTTATGTLEQSLDSSKAHSGDTFVLDLQPGWFHNKELKGLKLDGHLEGVEPAAKFHKKGAMDLVFDDLREPNGTTIPVDVRLLSRVKPQGHTLRNAAIIVGGAIVGHHMAAKSGQKHGALKGAAVATGVVLMMPGGNVVLKRGEKLEVKFLQPVTLQ
ncbi:MAG TPA: hypothetical protein V6D47_22565 [Oscillatoriaceae cyanobacterium]